MENIEVEANEKRIYMPIGAGRLIDIIVYLDDEKVYEGMIEEAPDEIKKLKYSDVKMGNQLTYYAYSELQ